VPVDTIFLINIKSYNACLCEVRLGILMVDHPVKERMNKKVDNSKGDAV
jgi:ABC-type lipopolysaccharide export system ATPase subunit